MESFDKENSVQIDPEFIDDSTIRKLFENYQNQKIDNEQNQSAPLFLGRNHKGHLSLRLEGMSWHSVDFNSASYLRWAKGGYGRRQLLPKALGVKGPNGLRVVDATAGFGSDTFVAALFAERVDAFEQNPIVFGLLQDGLERGLNEALQLNEVLQKIVLHPQRFCHEVVNEEWDVVFLDPMFENSHKNSALSQKSMQILQKLLGTEADEDYEPLMKAAQSLARQRVVVKRQKKLPPLANLKPSFSLPGERVRYDVYLTRSGV